MFVDRIINLPVNVSFTYYFMLYNTNGGIGSLGGAVTGKTFSTGGCKISNNGVSFINTVNLPTEIGNGWYSLVLTSGEMNFQDNLVFVKDSSSNYTAQAWLCTTSVGASSNSIAAAVLGSTISELSVVPSIGDTLANKIQAIYQYFFLKRTITTTNQTIYKSDSNTILGSSVVSDNGTIVTKGSIS